jgi:hypothetical protein
MASPHDSVPHDSVPHGMAPEDLSQELARLAAPTRSSLGVELQRAAHVQAVPIALPWILAFPLLYLMLRLLGVAWAPPMILLVLLSLLPALFVYAVQRQSKEREVEDFEALARIDDELELRDRLTAAREFLALEERTPFMNAAIADARAHLERAQAFRAETARARIGIPLRQLHWPAGAVLALWLSSFFAVPHASGSGESGEPFAAMGRNDIVAQVERQEPEPRERSEPRPERRSEASRASQEGSHKRGDSGELDPQRKRSRGEQGQGKSSQAQSSAGQSSGEGQSTDQAQSTKGGPKKRKKPKAQKPPKERVAKKRRKQEQLDQESVASSGQGKGRGSSRSPTASEWTSKDQSVADDEEELEDEDEVDDEDEESEARGGLQPALRSRKPPVNRDLNISFGGGPPPPNANGRGGPGLPKKQRGVAQLVLGIPYPDQIAGQPNPGRTKVTQERIEPQPQDAAPVEASARKERVLPMGHLSRPVLLPWMQRLVRDFQLSLQASLKRKPEVEPSRDD